MKLLYLFILGIAVYYLFKAFLRLIRMLFNSLGSSTSSGSSTYRIKNNKDEIIIEGAPTRFTSGTKGLGEYVDYEEIK
jgi:hypothetical protein